jgi:hypothetical protein
VGEVGGGDAIAKAAIDTAGFRFTSLEKTSDAMFLPGGAKYHDVPGLLALGAPGKLWLAGERADLGPVTAAYAAIAKDDSLTAAPPGADVSKVVEWLKQP